MKTNRQIVKDAALTTGGVTAGLLSPEQSRKFIMHTFEATPLGPLVRTEIRTAKTGEIDKIGINSRILRAKIENTDDNYRAKPTFGKLLYATKAVRLPWEITEETLRENIEGESLEDKIEKLMTTQVGVDTEDLCLNGDEATPEADPDYDFLKINDGWVKQLEAGAHVEDRSTKNAGAMSIDVYYDTLKQIPNKYNNGKLRWLMSPKRKQEWEKYLLDQIITNGGAVPEGVYTSPAAIPAIEVPALSDSKIILTDPKNLIKVYTYSMRIRKTTEGKEAIMQDKRFYVVHFDFDAIIEELDAAAVATGLAAI
jgi:hypothetical protein